MAGEVEKLRQAILTDFFAEGDEAADAASADDGASYSISDYLGSSGVLSLQDVDKDLEEFAGHEVIRGILEQGRVVKEYAREIDDKLRQVELESIQDYIQESDNMVALHEQIKVCDSILQNMELVLGRFQSDLGKVSEEIRHLQVQSQSMGTKLKNRRAAESQLGSFIEQLTISEDLVHSIMDAEVNEDSYVEALLALDKKLRFVREDPVARASAAKRDIEGALEKLRIKAVTKVREFMLARVYQLKRPKTNVQIIQQTVLLKYKYFMRFLRAHGADVYSEIRGEYIGVLSKILANHFRSYLAAMEKMQTAVAGAGDVLGAPDSSAGGGGGGLFGRGTGRPTTEATFSLGERAAVLEQLDKPAIIPHMAEFEGKKFPYEVIFRNVHKLLLDTATSEYLFCCDFFDPDEGGPVFKEMFAPIVAVVEGDLATNLQDLADLVSILLMIRINHDHRKLMARRRIDCLNDYLDRVHLLLWPRFKLLFDNQLQSVRSGTERALFVEHPSPSGHFVTRRYAALASSMLVLMAGYDQDDPGIFKAQSFVDMMERLWQAMHELLLRMSNLFKDRRTGIIFLIVQYNHIHVSLRAAAMGGRSSEGGSGSGGGGAQQAAASGAGGGGGGASSTAAAGIGRTGLTNLKECEDQLASCTGLYVDDQLGHHFRDLVDWVKKAEQAARRSGAAEGQPIPGYSPQQAAPLLRDFAARWQGAIDAMAREVSQQFAETTCGRDVLQASMTSLLKYYTRFLELLKRQGSEGLTLVREAVNVPSIMYEIKRITKA